MLLEVADLAVRYDKIEALRGISIKAAQGEIVAVIGPNGAGKTTTLGAISGILRSCGGSITYRDQVLDRDPAHKRVRLGISHVPEGRHVFAGMTVEENLLLGAFIRHGRGHNTKTDLEPVYKRFPVLAQRSHQPAGTLSGGEQQLLAIARGLMAEPQLLLLDEPSLGLAPLAVTSMFDALLDIRARGVTLILVEQNVYQALRIADRAYVLEAGRITRSGEAKELMNDEAIKHAYLGGTVASPESFNG
jgi:branched-chain amino acid transport system ATP-binding protein